MRVNRGRPRSKGRPGTTQSHGSDSTGKRTESTDGLTENQPRVEPFEFDCPRCDKRNTARLGREGAWLVQCWKCDVDEIADVLGCEVWELLEDAPRWLEPHRLDPGRTRRRAEGDPLPDGSRVRFWCELLPGSPGERWLREHRGVHLAVARAARVGWDGSRLTFPMFHRGQIVAAKWRLVTDTGQMRAWAGEGRDWPLYPEPEPGRRAVLLVAGELDALRGRAAGLPACSVTLGAGHWRDAWTDETPCVNPGVRGVG